MINEYLESKISNDILMHIYMNHYNDNNYEECIKYLNLSLEIYNNINDYEMKFLILTRNKNLNDIINFLIENNYNNSLPFFFKLNYLDNIKNINIIFTPKEEYRHFCYKCYDIIKDIQIPNLTLNLEYEAVNIEFRQLPNYEFIIKNAILKVGNKWSYTIVCGNLNYDYILKIVGNMNIKVIKVDIDNLIDKSYSKFLASKYFWNLLTGNKILFFEEDSFIFKSNIMDFIKWDYIGAPWPNKPNNLSVGNSGLSLVTRNVMLTILDNVQCENEDYYPYDVFICTHMNKFGLLADFKSALKFSSEGLLNINSFGCHALFNYTHKWRSIIYNNLINFIK
jgi:hypothetical protein